MNTLKLKFREIQFLVFFLPIYFLKLVDVTAEDRILVIISFGCTLFAMVNFVRQKMCKHIALGLGIIVLYTALLILTCGKQGAFFFAITMVALYRIRDKNNIFRVALIVGMIAIAIFCCMEWSVEVTIRFNGKEWVNMFKRTNILYISFLAVVVIFIYINKHNITKYRYILGIAILGLLMYCYTRSRTGFISYVILLFLLILARNKKIYENKIFKAGCIFSPIIGMGVSLFFAVGYGKIVILNQLNDLMQGRVYQNSYFFTNYKLKFWGQKIIEGIVDGQFYNLDCAYLDMLICYGVVFATLWLIISCKVISWLCRQERYIEVAIMVTYAIYGISETFLPNIFLNPSLFLYIEYMYIVLYNRCDNYKLEHGVF